MKRRQLLALGSLFTTLPFSVLASSKTLTPAQTEGPFYPVKAIPIDANLILKEDGVNGEIMLLSGHVLDRSGKALSNIKIEIWQCDGAGLYDHPRQANTNQFDKHFNGFGATTTDEQGAYNFRTLHPVPYTGRPPHIHVKLWRDQQELLTTQLYLKGQTGTEWFGGDRSRLQISPQRNSTGHLNAKFGFVV